MAKNMKHIGKISNTGLKCIVVFREIYDERGNVTDDKNCLIVETERLPDMEHDDMVNMLKRLHEGGYLKKYPTDQVNMTPNNHTSVKLSDINQIVRKQSSGMSERDITNSMVNDTDSPPRTQTSLDPTQTIDQAVNTGEQVLDETAIAKSLLSQADTFLAEAERLRDEAYDMAPDLKPKRGRPKKATVSANT